MTVTPPAFQEPAKDSGEPDVDTLDGGNDTDDLGDSGQKALRAERTKARAEAKRARELETKLAALQAQVDKGSKAPDTVDTKAIAEAAKAEARAELLKDRAVDKIEMLAAKSFANPAMASRLLSSQVEEFIEGGKVDTEAITDALEDLLRAEPYLASAPPKRFKGTGDGGQRGDGRSEPDLESQIADALGKRDVMRAIHLENTKLIPHIRRIQGLQP